MSNRPSEGADELANILQQKHQLERLSFLLDEAFTIPVIGVRIGWDAIIGLVPVIGDGLGAVISSYFVYKAMRFKLPATTVVKMLLNIGIELILGMIPLLGDILDVGWKANRRNYQLIEVFLAQKEQGLIQYTQLDGTVQEGRSVEGPRGTITFRENATYNRVVVSLILATFVTAGVAASLVWWEPLYQALQIFLD